MQKMEEAIEQRVIAGKISAAKRKQKQIEQLKQLEINLSVNDSNERPLNECSANVQQIKEKKIKEINKDDEEEKWRKWNENEIRKDMRISKLEDLSSANRDNQVIEL